jgi:hypothetical protein
MNICFFPSIPSHTLTVVGFPTVLFTLVTFTAVRSRRMKVRFQVLMAAVLLDVTPCSLVDIDRR